MIPLGTDLQGTRAMLHPSCLRAGTEVWLGISGSEACHSLHSLDERFQSAACCVQGMHESVASLQIEVAAVSRAQVGPSLLRPIGAPWSKTCLEATLCEWDRLVCSVP